MHTIIMLANIEFSHAKCKYKHASGKLQKQTKYKATQQKFRHPVTSIERRGDQIDFPSFTHA